MFRPVFLSISGAYEGFAKCTDAQSRGVLTEQEYWAVALMKLGRAKEALPMMESAMPTWRKMLGSGPDLSEPLFFLSKAYIDTGNFQDGEKAAEELVAVQEGKVSATDRRIGASHQLWARALVGQHRDMDALTHTEIADRLLAVNAVSAGGKQMTAEAHQLLLDIQRRLSK